ncbi:MAG: hypothetical protein K6F57_01635 [Candidatus Saccharibacteria bacterium]|nr:hypothetical protein [Candidatus Saccharibacteria bacterium]
MSSLVGCVVIGSGDYGVVTLEAGRIAWVLEANGCATSILSNCLGVVSEESIDIQSILDQLKALKQKGISSSKGQSLEVGNVVVIGDILGVVTKVNLSKFDGRATILEECGETESLSLDKLAKTTYTIDIQPILDQLNSFWKK